jgi:hypothetical protein
MFVDYAGQGEPRNTWTAFHPLLTELTVFILHGIWHLLSESERDLVRLPATNKRGDFTLE